MVHHSSPVTSMSLSSLSADQHLLQVCAVTQGGAFAAEAVIKEGGVIKLPSHVDLVAAAGLPVAFGTAHLALKERCQVKPGTSACHMRPLTSSRHSYSASPISPAQSTLLFK